MEKWFCQNSFPVILRLKKKVPFATKLERVGVNALVAGPLKITFFAASLKQAEILIGVVIFEVWP